MPNDKDLVDKLAAAGYKASVTEVEELARLNIDTVTRGERVAGGYFRILLRAGQEALPVRQQGRKIDHAQIFLKVNEPLYAAVLRGITTPDIAPNKEADDAERRRRSLARNARSAFARQAKSEILRFIKVGGDLRKLDVTETSKLDLKRRTLELMPEQEPQEALTDFVRHTADSLTRGILRLARVSTADARKETQAVVSLLANIMGPAVNSTKEGIKKSRPIDLEGAIFLPVSNFDPIESKGIQ